MAGTVGRVLTGMGGRVLRLDTVSTKINNCVVRARKEVLDNYVTVAKIKKIWNCGEEVNENPGRVDVEVWLGES